MARADPCPEHQEGHARRPLPDNTSEWAPPAARAPRRPPAQQLPSSSQGPTPPCMCPTLLLRVRPTLEGSSARASSRMHSHACAQVGDALKMCSAVFGEDMWPAVDIRRVQWAINNRTSKVRACACARCVRARCVRACAHARVCARMHACVYVPACLPAQAPRGCEGPQALAQPAAARPWPTPPFVPPHSQVKLVLERIGRNSAPPTWYSKGQVRGGRVCGCACCAVYK